MRQYYLDVQRPDWLTSTNLKATSTGETDYSGYLMIFQSILSAYLSYAQGNLMKKYFSTQAEISGLQTTVMRESFQSQAEISRMQGEMQKAYYETNSYIADINSRIGELEAQTTEKLTEIQIGLLKDKAEEAIQIGHEKEARYRQGVGKVIGRQRAAMAAQGIRIDEGSAEDIMTETANIGEFDAVTIKNNAAKEAFGYKAQAITTKISGSQAATKQRLGALGQKSTAADMMIRGAIAELSGNAEAFQNLSKAGLADLMGQSSILENLTKAEVYGRAGETEAIMSLLGGGIRALGMRKEKWWD